MDCDGIRELLPAYRLGELPPGTVQRIASHLRVCAACAQAHRDLEGGADAVVPHYLVAYLLGEAAEAERRAVEEHLPLCEACRRDMRTLEEGVRELTKHLSQYRLTPVFRARVMQSWEPHRLGQPRREGLEGLAELLDRAERGNTYTFERLVTRFQDYVYVVAILRVRDALWAEAAARRLFAEGFPPFSPDLDAAGLRRWFRERVESLVAEGGWEEVAPEAGAGLSGYHRSRKLRRHHLLLDFAHSLPEEARIPFFLLYVQRLPLAEVALLLERPRETLLLALDRHTREATALLHEDAEAGRQIADPAPHP